MQRGRSKQASAEILTQTEPIARSDALDRFDQLSSLSPASRRTTRTQRLRRETISIAGARDGTIFGPRLLASARDKAFIASAGQRPLRTVRPMEGTRPAAHLSNPFFHRFLADSGQVTQPLAPPYAPSVLSPCKRPPKKKKKCSRLTGRIEVVNETNERRRALATSSHRRRTTSKSGQPQ